jgi:hypothetical protein
MTMDWKSKLQRKGEETAGKILPMEDVASPRFGIKARIAAALAGIAMVLTLISQYLGS